MFSKRHIDKTKNPYVVIVDGLVCESCYKIYKSYLGWWAHRKKCKAIKHIIFPAHVPVKTDLLAKVDNLERVFGKLTDWSLTNNYNDEK